MERSRQMLCLPSQGRLAVVGISVALLSLVQGVGHGVVAEAVQPARQASCVAPGSPANPLPGAAEKEISVASTVAQAPSVAQASSLWEKTVASSPEPHRQVASLTGPRDLFELQGIDQSHFALFADGTPWQEGENETLLKIMYRLHRNFRLKDVEAWSLGEPDPAELAHDPDAYRGEIFHLAGRVIALDVLRPVPEAARRFELSEYYRCEFSLGDDQQPAVVFAHTVPEAWTPGESISGRAGAFAVFLKLESEDPERSRPVFVASRVAWYPPTRLSNLGFDWGLFDELRPGKSADRDGKTGRPKHRSLSDLRLTGRNRECFYQMLAAVGRAKPGELLAEATAELRRTGKARFSVVPLFNQPLQQQGRLVKLSGTARQVIPIRVSDEDVVSRFGINRYYQVFLFTEDSQGNPLVFCVRELPEGIPLGEGPEFGEYVTVAGFFFNTWAYRSRRSGEATMAREQWQLAPLLIGRDLKWRPRRKPASNPYLGAIAGGLFVLALLGIWVALWRYARGDQQFYDTTIARKFAPDAGVSLDSIGLRADGTPDFRGLEQAADSEANGSREPPNREEPS